MCPACVPTGHRYVLAYIESFRGVRAGQKVWQLGFGSGFKVNSAVWVANKRIQVRIASRPVGHAPCRTRPLATSHLTPALPAAAMAPFRAPGTLWRPPPPPAHTHTCATGATRCVGGL
jgi:hypothetical protein